MHSHSAVSFKNCTVIVQIGLPKRNFRAGLSLSYLKMIFPLPFKAVHFV